MAHKQVMHLYRNMLKYASKFTHYNFREYSLRRVKYEFRANKTVDQPRALELYKDGLKQFDVLKRQSIISQLYPVDESVLENKPKGI